MQKHWYNYFCIIISLIFVVTSEKMTRLTSKRFAKLNLPEVMRSNQIGTWAFDTMSRRINNEILERIIDDNADELTYPTSPYRSECLLSLNDLRSSLQCGKSGYLRPIIGDNNVPDLKEWQNILFTVPENERNWLDCPWIISEFYFYRRIIEAFSFFPTGYDMFIKQKVAGLLNSIPVIKELAKRVPALISEGTNKDNLANCIEVAIHTSLWGNKMDLSLWPSANNLQDLQMDKSSSTSEKSISSANENISGKITFGEGATLSKRYILDDKTAGAIDILLNNPQRDVSIILDNAGYELISDFLLGHCLLEWGICDTITFHTKAHPTFVSDATTNDCTEHISYLKEHDDKDVAALGNCLSTHIQEGRFIFSSDLFWCQPTSFWDMPENVEKKFSDSKLVFVKGDANYRRLLGERQWPLHTNAADVLSYWPVPVCACRTFKSEIGVGINESDQKRAQDEDKNYLVSGKWGVIQIGYNKLV
jgi:uncharacterized protein with ATP-grasp and redox domains